MAQGFNWTCPTCGSHTTITTPNFARRGLDVICSNTRDAEGIRLWATLIECPNPSCRAQAFSVEVRRAARDGRISELKEDSAVKVGIGNFVFLPTSATPLSKHVPASVASDYNEAYLISTLSPKASATLARRALQGMIRDFWKVTGLRTLHAELVAIKGQCDDDLYEAMMAVKSVGNIGAHPEQDVNLIVDVEPGEPEKLLSLIHLLDLEWYVARASKRSRIADMKALGESKKPAPPDAKA